MTNAGYTRVVYPALSLPMINGCRGVSHTPPPNASQEANDPRRRVCVRAYAIRPYSRQPKLFLLCSTLGNDLALRFDPFPTLGNDLALRFDPLPTLGNDLALRFDPFPDSRNHLAQGFDPFPDSRNDLALRFDPFPDSRNDLSRGFNPFPDSRNHLTRELDSKKNQVLHLLPAASAKALAEVSTSGKGDQ